MCSEHNFLRDVSWRAEHYTLLGETWDLPSSRPLEWQLLRKRRAQDVWNVDSLDLSHLGTQMAFPTYSLLLEHGDPLREV